MTIDELLETVSPEVKQAIEDICDRAGTWDAHWSVLKAAGELLANERVNSYRYLLGLDRQKNDQNP